MADNAPQIDVGSRHLNEVELFLTRGTLSRIADFINRLSQDGPVWPLVILSPEEAELKRQSMNGG